MLSLMRARSFAISSMSEALPRHTPDASWIISIELGAISTRSPAIAMTEAMDAATLSTWMVTFAGWERSALAMAMPSNTDPPGELIRTAGSAR
jgi:hypothetical protein